MSSVSALCSLFFFSVSGHAFYLLPPTCLVFTDRCRSVRVSSIAPPEIEMLVIVIVGKVGWWQPGAFGMVRAFVLQDEAEYAGIWRGMCS